MEQTNIAKKGLKKDIRSVGLASLIYAAIGFVLYSLFQNVIPLFLTEASTEQYIAKFNNSGIPAIVIILIGIIFYFLFFVKQGIHKEIFKTENRMTFPHCSRFFCLYVFIYILGVVLSLLVEGGLNTLGHTGNAIPLVAGGQATTASMVIYACILGPIAEELIWRGFLLRTLQKYGKATAVIITSVLFGLMHGNIPQAIQTTLFGLLWGYITIEYSIKWSITLHIFHNSFIAIFPFLIQCSELLVCAIVLIFLVAALAGVVILIRKRKSITVWVRNNIWEKPQMKWIITSVWMWLPIAYYLFEIMQAIQKI